MPTKTNKSPINFSVSGFLAPILANRMSSVGSGPAMPSLGGGGLANVLINKKQASENNKDYDLNKGLMDFAIGSLGKGNTPSTAPQIVKDNSPVMNKKTSKSSKSPLHMPPGMIMTLGKAAIGMGASNLSNMPTEFKQIRKEGEGNRSVGGFLKGTGRMLGAFSQSTLSGLSKGLIGTDFGLGQKGVLADNTPKTPQEQAAESAKKYSTNIDIYGEETSPNKYLENQTIESINAGGTKMKPLKELAKSQGKTAKNMSAFQYKSALKMSVVSGASTLPSALTLKGDQYKIDVNKDGEITGEDFKLLKNK